MSHRTLIICIGNQLVADDGVGWEIFQRLRQDGLPDQVRLEFLGLGGIDLLEEIAGEDLLVVVDAVQLGHAPGTSIPSVGKNSPPFYQGRSAVTVSVSVKP